MTRFLLLFLFMAATAYSQINPADSTVQIISYWDKNENFTYNISHKKYKLKDNDSIFSYQVNYKAYVNVIDSTETSYTVEWKFRDCKSSQNNIAAKIEGLVDGLTVRYKTNEMGEYQELLNREEVYNHQLKATEALQKEYKTPKHVNNVLKLRLTPENLEELVLKDILQFHAFYGQSLGRGEEFADTIEEKNNFGVTVKSNIYLVLEEIDFEEEAYLVKFYQTYDEATINQALDNVIEEYISEGSGTVKTSGLEDYYGCYFHNTGWPLNNYYQRDMVVNGELSIESRSIDLE